MSKPKITNETDSYYTFNLEAPREVHKRLREASMMWDVSMRMIIIGSLQTCLGRGMGQLIPKKPDFKIPGRLRPGKRKMSVTRRFSVDIPTDLFGRLRLASLRWDLPMKSILAGAVAHCIGRSGNVLPEEFPWEPPE